LVALETLGGLEGVATKLKTDYRLGISATTVDELN